MPARCLRFVSDHAFNGYRTLCQHKLLRSHAADYPTARYYPPTLLEWNSARQQTNMALPVRLPSGNVVECHLDSWANGEELARLALCAWCVAFMLLRFMSANLNQMIVVVSPIKIRT